jgi:transcriptional regulator with XRE-family HTH domain
MLDKDVVAEGTMDDLKTLRDLAGLTQNRASRAAGISRSRLSEIECDEVTITREEELRLRRVLLRAIETRAAQMSGLLSHSSDPSDSAPAAVMAEREV